MTWLKQGSVSRHRRTVISFLISVLFAPEQEWTQFLGIHRQTYTECSVTVWKEALRMLWELLFDNISSKKVTWEPHLCHIFKISDFYVVICLFFSGLFYPKDKGTSICIHCSSVILFFFFFLHQDTQKAKQFLPFLQRAGRSEAVVEYVFSGSRLKLYLPKETCLITFLLAGECVPQVTPSVLPWSLKPSCFSSIPPNTGE